jgi:hypothetical protein
LSGAAFGRPAQLFFEATPGRPSPTLAPFRGASEASPAMKVLWIQLAILVVLAAIVGGTWMSATNREASLRNRFDAKQKANEASFDTMWKVIEQKGGVAANYKDAFKDIFTGLIAGRYSGDKSPLLKFIVESNPRFDSALYKSVASSIESERHRFLKDQQLLLDIKREHDDLRTRFPSRLFVGGAAPLEPHLVTSDRTEEVFRTGKENLGGR